MTSLFIACAILVVVFSQDDNPTNTFGDDIENPAEYDYDKIKFDNEVNQKPHFIKFYAPWCGHCQRLEPVWEELATQFNIEGREDTVTIASVDCTKHGELCSEQNVQGYPTLKFYKNGENEKYQGGRDFQSLSSFLLDSSNNIKSDNGLFTLTESNFADHIAEGHHFIKFFAPWCGHCQTLAPTWKSLAEKVSGNDELNVKISDVDCTTASQVCKDQDIKGYPTLIYFKDGVKAEKYQGSRTEDKFVDFIERMLGEQAIADNSQNNEEKVLDPVQIDDAAATVKRDGNVLVGTEDNFGHIIANHYTFVKFYAPWCGHCKGMANDWSLLADKYASKYEIKIAEIDCTAHSIVCQKYEIEGYPTLLLFDAGNKKEEYEHDRDLASFIEFIKEETPINHDEL